MLFLLAAIAKTSNLVYSNVLKLGMYIASCGYISSYVWYIATYVYSLKLGGKLCYKNMYSLKDLLGYH